MVLPPGLPGQFNHYVGVQFLVPFLPRFPSLVGPPTHCNRSLFSRYKALWALFRPLATAFSLPEPVVDPVASLCDQVARGSSFDLWASPYL